MKYTINPKCEELLKEPCFELFKLHDLWCCILRVMWSGHLCGYVAVPETHSFYGRQYSDKVVTTDIQNIKFNGNYIGLIATPLSEVNAGIISMDMLLDVHYGLTYSNNILPGIKCDCLGKLWWFGFDTAHSGDAKPFQDEIDRKYQHSDDTYKNFLFMREEITKLSLQLSKL